MMTGAVRTPFDLPAYQEAVERETFVREAAFLDVTETVGGFELRPMTFADFITLKATRNPLLWGGLPTPLQLISFLWVLSPEYSPTDLVARGRFVARCEPFLPPSQPKFKFAWVHKLYLKECERCLARTTELIGAIRRYVDETMMDWPSTNAQGRDVNYYGDGAGICALLAREYNGWTPATTLALPMKQLLQFLKEITKHNLGTTAALANPLSDKVKAEFLRQINRRN